MSSETELPAFSGTPRRYMKVALAIGVLSHAWLYAGLYVVEHLWLGREWITRAPAVCGTVVSAGVLTVYAYIAIMNLDARWGTGSRWRLVERKVKLPDVH